MQELGEEEVLGRMLEGSPDPGSSSVCSLELPATSPQEKEMLCSEEPGALHTSP